MSIFSNDLSVHYIEYAQFHYYLFLNSNLRDSY